MAIVGREAELDVVRRFFTAGSGTRALLLHGEAGIGKSTIWQQALTDAEGSGFRVISSRPTEAEARLPYSALVDLFGDVLDEIQPDLPPPQRLALDVALLRTTVKDQRPEPLAISLAILALVREAATRAPLAIGIDDIPWLDHSSASVLEFVLRRLDTEPVALVVAERSAAGAGGRPSVVAALAAERITDLSVAPLSPADIDRLLAEVLGLHLAPSKLKRVHRTSGGNPFYAVEIGRAFQARGSTGEVPLPESLTSLLRGRLAALSTDARDVVNHAAAVSQPTAALLEAAIGRQRARDGMAEARKSAVLSADDDPIRFTHPLLSAEAYAGIAEADRRDLHRRLAAVVAEPEQLARHLALAATGPGPDVADALDRAAIHAHGRGAPDAAAELSEMAVGMTPDDDPAIYSRMAAAGRYWMMAGDFGRARQLLEQALVEPDRPTGPSRAALLLALAIVRELMDDFSAAEAIGLEALRHAQKDLPLMIELKLVLAGVSHITGRNWGAGARHAFEAMHLADELGDPRILAGTIGHYAIWRYVTGHGREPGLARRAAELEPWTGHLRTLDLPAYDFQKIEYLEGDTSTAREHVHELLDRAESDGDYSSLPFLLGTVGFDDFVIGAADAGRERIERAARLAQVTGQQSAQADAAVNRARLEARLGNADAAWAAAREAFEHMAATRWRIGEWAMRHDLALLELSRDDPAAALEVVAGAIDPSGPDESERWEWGRAPAVEALVALGRHDEAHRVLDALERYVKRVGWPIFGAWAARARARLLAGEGDLHAATISIAEAEANHRRMGDRWELGRTLLVSGEIHRRARRRAKARTALTEALETFEFLGARLWARNARQQVVRIGAAREDPLGLTATQREVAELVAGRLTNRQVADRLFMSVHTVEAHLSAIYRTLDIGSRRDLAWALRRMSDTVQDSDDEFRDSARAAEPET